MLVLLCDVLNFPWDLLLVSEHILSNHDRYYTETSIEAKISAFSCHQHARGRWRVFNTQQNCVATIDFFALLALPI